MNEGDGGKTLDKNKNGVARELARMVLPLNAYTEWYWKIDLHNLMHFLSLRFDYHAQYEIRVYAEVMLNILKKWVPLTYEAFISHRLENISLSNKVVSFINLDALRFQIDAYRGNRLRSKSRTSFLGPS